tara:strand:- start:494 stop:910 length:417 start_codon:yes stop_codon:yes gene_type:complete
MNRELKNQSSITARKWYTDIDFNLKPHPSSGDLTLKYDKEAIKGAIRNIILTNKYERPFKPNLGANLRTYIFELSDDITRFEIRKRIIDALETFEPRVRISEINLSTSGMNRLHVNIGYGIVGIAEPQNLEVTLERVR